MQYQEAMYSMSVYLTAIAFLFSISTVYTITADEYTKEQGGQDNKIVSILQMLIASAHFIPIEIREIINTALNNGSIDDSEDFEQWMKGLLKKLSVVDDDQGGYKHFIIEVIISLTTKNIYDTVSEKLLSRVKISHLDISGVDLFWTFSIFGTISDLITEKPNCPYSMELVLSTTTLNPGDCLAVKTWTDWWTFMIVTDNNHRKGLISVVCYVSSDSGDCIQSEIFSTSSLQEVSLNVSERELYLVKYDPASTLSASTTIKRAKSKRGYSKQWDVWLSNTSEHFVSWAKVGEATSCQVDLIKWYLKKHTAVSQKGYVGVLIELALLGYELYQDYDLYISGKISRKEFCKRVTSSMLGSVGSISGLYVGASVGTAIFPGGGTFLGGLFGSLSGFFTFRSMGSAIGDQYFCEFKQPTALEDKSLIMKPLNMNRRILCNMEGICSADNLPRYKYQLFTAH